MTTQTAMHLPLITTTTIDARFNGPPHVGNGGIVCALIAEHCGDAFEAELRLPAPIERPLQIEADPSGEVELRDGDAVIACGRPADLELAVPTPPTPREAECAHHEALLAPHPYPDCFVCGPARARGDGLRIVPGPIPGRTDLVASPWVPDASLADANDTGNGNGTVAARFTWASLDCPGGIAAASGRSGPILLARFRGRIERRPRVGERCTLIGWVIERDGRKHRAGTALFDEEARVLGRSEQLWIEPRPRTMPA